MDSEVLKLENVLKTLQGRTATPRNYEHFENEIKDRFWEVGFRVDVKWWETNIDGTLIPEIEVTERIEGEFNPEQQAHEVVNNIVGIPEDEGKGVIKTSAKEVEMLREGIIKPNNE